VDVYDSGVWVYGSLRRAPEAVALMEEVVERDHYVAISAYIHGEVTEAFDRSMVAGGDDIREAKKRFNAIVAKRHNVEFPGHQAIGQMDIHEVRRQQPVRLLASAWGIQAKDVPIMMFAEQLSGESTVFTTDGPLADFDPESAGVDGVAVEHVPTP
jgi:hypothetical protein